MDCPVRGRKQLIELNLSDPTQVLRQFQNDDVFVFDRIELRWTPESGAETDVGVVLDAVPEPVPSWLFSPSTLKLERDQAGQRHRLIICAQLRVLIAHIEPRLVSVEAELVLEPDGAGRSKPKLDKLSCALRRLKRAIALESVTAEMLQSMPAVQPLLRTGFGSFVEAIGVSPAAPIPDLELTLDESPPWREDKRTIFVPAARCPCYLLPWDQVWRLGNISLEMKSWEIIAAGLHLIPLPKEYPVWLVRQLILPPPETEVVEARPRVGGELARRWMVGVTHVPGPPVWRAWNKHVALPYLADLRSVQGARPISALPALVGNPAAAAMWMTTLEIWDTLSAAEIKKKDVNHGGPHRDEAITTRLRSLEPLFGGGQGRLEFPNISTHGGEGLTIAAEILNTNPLNPQLPADELLKKLFEAAACRDSGFRFDVAPLDEGEPDNPQSVRMGSLDLLFYDAPRQPPSSPLKDDDPCLDHEPLEHGCLDLRPPHEIARDPQPQLNPLTELGTGCVAATWSVVKVGEAGVAALPRISVRLELGVLQADAAGQDDLPGESGAMLPEISCGSGLGERSAIALQQQARFLREPPLVFYSEDFRGKARGISQSPTLVLSLEEATSCGASQHLRLALLRPLEATEAANAIRTPKVVVLDRHPFLVALLDAPEVSRLPVLDSQRELANWSTERLDGPSWRLRTESQPFLMSLPPQSLGEQVERIEGDVKRLEPIDYRLSPPALVRLKSNFDQRQRFTEVCWNLRRLLGYPGQRATGAPLLWSRLELLYGMICEFEGPAQFAELGALLGAAAKALPRESGWTAPPEFFSDRDRALQILSRLRDQYADDWGKHYSAWLSRLGVLEPWREWREPLVKRDGVRFALRSTAKLKYPAPFRPADSRAPDDPDGINGGVAAPFAFASVYEALWKQPFSIKGELHRPLFSALGGWGHQKAVFDNGLTTIYSDTALGRNFLISAERIGRIACLWHRAKHVVVFERTVVPSDQFAPEQGLHPGRPLLRKVAEYIELLQDERRYPETVDATVDVARRRGPLMGVRFQSKIIPVTSSWGSDVFDDKGELIGAQIPLWRADVDPRIYPKPQIFAQLAADAAKEGLVVEGEIENPQDLRFFTWTKPGVTSDTDSWEELSHVDLPACPVPTSSDAAAFDPSDMDASLGDAVQEEPLMRHFVLRLKPTGQAVNVLKDRSENALGTILENVWIARGRILAEAEQSPAQKHASEVVGKSLRVRDEISHALDELVRALPDAATLPDELKRRFEDRIDTLSQKAKDLAASIGPEIQMLQPGVLETRIRSVLKKRVESQLNRYRGLLTEFKVSSLASALEEAAKVAARLEDQTKLAIQTVEDLLSRVEVFVGTQRAGVESLLGELADLGSRLKSNADELNALLLETNQKFVSIAERAANNANQALTDARLLIERMRATLAAWIDRLRSHANQIRPFARAVADPIESVLSVGRDAIDKAMAKGMAELADATDSDAKDRIEQANEFVRAAPEALAASLNQQFSNIEDKIAKVNKDILDAVRLEWGNVPIPTWAEARTSILSKIVAANPAAAFDAMRSELLNQYQGFEDFAKLLSDNLANEIAVAIQANLFGVFADVSKFLDELAIKVSLNKAVDEIRREAIGYIRDLGVFATDLSDTLTREIGAPLSLAKDRILGVIGAIGAPPIVEGLNATRERINYFLDPLKKAIDTTPVTMLANRVGDELKAMGLRVPTKQLLDRFVPDELKNFDIGKIIPDLGALRLANLFDGIKLPNIANDNVKVTHGVDKQARRGWLQADLDVPFDEPATLFSFSPIALRMLKMRLTATTRIEAALGGGPPVKTARGEIKADWQMSIGGARIITLRDTRLAFDESGRIDIDIEPKKVDFAGALKFLADLLKRAGGGGGGADGDNSGLNFQLLEKDGKPSGLIAALNLPDLSLQFGAFGVRGLQLGASLSVKVLEGFEIRAAANLSRKTSPFTIIIFCLNGGGWVEITAAYRPLKGEIESTISIGIVAGASIGFAFGPVKGSVAIYFGIELQFQAASGKRAQLSITIMLLVTGEVDVCGIISAAISLLLEATYRQDGSLTGRGTLSIRIKICWCFTLKVKTSVTYSFAKGSSGSEAQSNRLERTVPALVGVAIADGAPDDVSNSPTSEVRSDIYEVAAEHYLKSAI